MILTRPQKNTEQDINYIVSIKQLLEFERFCRDNALWDEMKKCYLEDSKITISWFQGTGHEFVEESKKMLVRAPHKIYNTGTWINGDKAVAIMLTTIQCKTEIDGCELELLSDAKLVFRVQRVDGMWYIAAMEAIYEKDSLVPVLANCNFTLDKKELAGYRESYACLAWSLQKQGYEINNNLPGIDRPDLVEKLYKDADKWLCE